ncbi:MAG: SPOR domain-containing protein [Gemmatimonadota bacterium]
MRILALACTLFVLGLSPATAQEGPSLNEVEALMAQGRIMEAREILENWWTTRLSLASRTDRQRGIWLRGKLTVDPALAELDFRRLVLEFPGGPFSDDALVRLGLSAELRGDLREAQAAFQSLARDYPSSPRVPEAELWVRTHAGEIAALPPGPPPPASEPTEEALVQEVAGNFSVQLGAFRSLDGARSLADQLRVAGYQPRLVRTPGNDLARVRIGRFASRERAEALAGDLEGRGFAVTLVTDAGSEERIGKP